MKYVKMFSLAAMAAMALMAIAAGTASAETGAVICSTDEEEQPILFECAGGEHGYEYHGKIIASLAPETNATLVATNSSGGTVSTVKCSQSVVSGTVTAATGGTGAIEEMTFGTCSSPACFNGVEASTKASTTNKWHTTVTTTTKKVDTNGIMHVSNVGGKFVCKNAFGFGFNVTCEYESATATAHVTGSDTTPIITATNVPLNRIAGAEFVCGVKGDWSGTYHVTTPTSLFIL
jgi:hypothetical protein